MTDAVNVVVGDQPIAEDLPAPAAGHYYATIKGRRILVKNINPAQSMVLGGYLRQIKGEVDYEKIIGIFGKLMQLVENLITQPEDIEWLETQILDGVLEVEDFAGIFHSYADTVKPVAAKKPRRGK